MAEALYSNSAVGFGVTSTTTKSTAEITLDGTNRVLYAFVASSAGTPAGASTVKWNTTEDLTKLGELTTAIAGDKFSVWRLINPSAVASTVDVVYSASQDEQLVIGIGVKDCHQTTPNNVLGTNQGVSADVNTTVDCAAPTGKLIIDAVYGDSGGINNYTISPTSSQTQRAKIDGADTHYEAMGVATKTSATDPTTSTWAFSGNEDWAAFSLSLNGVTSGTTLTASAGSISIVGKSASLYQSLMGGTFTVRDTLTQLKVTKIASGSGLVVGSSKAFIGDGFVGSGLIAYNMYAYSGNVYITGNDATLTQSGGGSNTTLTASAGTINITGVAANLTNTRVLLATVGNVILSGNAANLFSTRKIFSDAGSIVITLNPASLLNNQILLAAAGAITITGVVANLNKGQILTASTGSIVISGVSAGSIHTYTLTCTTGAIIISGNSATLTKSGAVLSASSGIIIITRNPNHLIVHSPKTIVTKLWTIAQSYDNRFWSAWPAGDKPIILTASTGVIVITGNAATLIAPRKITAAAGTISITGSANDMIPMPAILDTFTNTNATDLPTHGGWSAMTNGVNMEIQANTATGITNGSNNINYRNSGNFGPNTAVGGTITTKPTDGQLVLLLARLVQETDLTTVDGYALQFAPVAGTDTLQFQVVTNGALTPIGSAISQEIAAGDAIAFKIRSGSLQAYYKPSGSTWRALGSPVSDSTYSAAGKIGVYTNSNVVRIDDFIGGTI